MYTKLALRPQMKMNPQLVIAGKLLQVPGSELELFINRELENNPALELTKKPDFIKERLQHAAPTRQSSLYSTGFSSIRSNRQASFDEIVENIPQHQSPLEKLAEQVSMELGKNDHEIALYLLHRLDHRGYLVTPTEQLASDLGVSKEKIMQVIQILHQLEPPGIGARDIQECFLIQCMHLEAEGMNCEQVLRILTLAWDEFLNQQWGRVARKIQQPKRVVEDACEFMRLKFYPHPLAILETSVETDKTLYYADLIILRDNQADRPAYLVEIPGEEDFNLMVSTSFQNTLDPKTSEEYGLSTQEKTWIREHLDRAQILISALRQRWKTLRQIGEYLVQYQNDFIELGPLYLKPLTRAIVARELNVHESTISRAVRDKVIQLPNGQLIPLSNFFDSSLAAKAAIRLLLRDNFKDSCDREIAERLHSSGINLSRRTVAKYRNEINANSSRQSFIGMQTEH